MKKYSYFWQESADDRRVVEHKESSFYADISRNPGGLLFNFPLVKDLVLSSGRVVNEEYIDRQCILFFKDQALYHKVRDTFTQLLSYRAYHELTRALDLDKSHVYFITNTRDSSVCIYPPNGSGVVMVDVVTGLSLMKSMKRSPMLQAGVGSCKMRFALTEDTNGLYFRMVSALFSNKFLFDCFILAKKEPGKLIIKRKNPMLSQFDFKPMRYMQRPPSVPVPKC